jgi:GNAT superfamily N-acetyltransferase
MDLRSSIRHLLYRFFNYRPSDFAWPIYDKNGRRYWAGYDQDEGYDFPWSFSVGRYNQIVGLINIGWDENSKDIDLGDVFIVTKYRNRGIGTAFLQWFIQILRNQGAKCITGFVHPEDWEKLSSLVDWYKRNGFTVTGKNERYVLSMLL